MRYGLRIQGRLVAVPESLRVSKPGEVIEFHVYTDEPFDDDKAPISQLMLLEQQYPDLKVEYVETFPVQKTVVLQVRDMGPGGFVVGGIVSLIPTVFILIGLVVVGIIAWDVIQSQADWLLWLGLFAAAGIVFYYFVGKTIPSPKAIRTENQASQRVTEKANKKMQTLRSLRVGYQNQRDSWARKKAELDREMESIEKKIESLQNKRPRGYTKKVVALEDGKSRLEEKKREAEEKFWKADEEHDKIMERISQIETV